jgi:hypothetical protein
MKNKEYKAKGKSKKAKTSTQRICLSQSHEASKYHKEKNIYSTKKYKVTIDRHEAKNMVMIKKNFVVLIHLERFSNCVLCLRCG